MVVHSKKSIHPAQTSCTLQAHPQPSSIINLPSLLQATSSAQGRNSLGLDLLRFSSQDSIRNKQKQFPRKQNRNLQHQAGALIGHSYSHAKPEQPRLHHRASFELWYVSIGCFRGEGIRRITLKHPTDVFGPDDPKNAFRKHPMDLRPPKASIGHLSYHPSHGFTKTI
ncbi:hypothetical protein MJO28_001730 [Puccinia striiformis f. sp. tritici]|uniref:Uncharacterized protein n=1 Tax=Puccinia striiformis f. sp. tritici TaxID=168172 RepID=A0ACC0EUS8_9BASI|nr:hypothetical protein MJO28_001730 [Puccinia striiformis f. sp. tritici]